MSVTVKLKSGTKSKPKTDQSVVLQARVERAYKLKQELDAAKAVDKEYKSILSDFRGLTEDSDPTVPVTFVGTDHKLVLSECPLERTIVSNDKVIEILGTKVFQEIAKVTLKDLEKYLVPEELAKVVSEDRTGTRRVTFGDA